MKKSTFLSIVLIVAILITITPAAAQEGDQWPTYIINAGDYLTSVASRFGISYDELIAYNNITDPNYIQPGDEIFLPGLKGITGSIQNIEMPLGESLRSLTRRYQMAPDALLFLNQVSSPSQLYAGYPLLVASSFGDMLNTRRQTIGTGKTMLELAVSEGKNPASITGLNRLSSASLIVPSDVLLIPNTQSTGPGGLPSPITKLTVKPGRFYQGMTFSIAINADQPLQLSGNFVGHQFNFFEENGTYYSLNGTNAMLEPGYYPLTLTGQYENGQTFEYSQPVYVKDGGYETETLTVQSELLRDDLDQQEYDLFASYTTNITPTRMWTGYWATPSYFKDDVYNSYFGTRRSYNGGSYFTFHAGLDFGGGVGTPILAPAVGTVVYTDLLDIHGNTTIIDHGWGVYSIYCHQSEFQVNVGDTIQPNQTIGLVGNTGRSGGAHLHWEIWVNGEQVQPFDWIYYMWP